MSSFVECVERIFGDSDLDATLRSGPAFTPEIDDDLRKLSNLVDEIDGYQRAVRLLRDPKFLASRELAAHVLVELREIRRA